MRHIFSPAGEVRKRMMGATKRLLNKRVAVICLGFCLRSLRLQAQNQQNVHWGEGFFKPSPLHPLGFDVRFSTPPTWIGSCSESNDISKTTTCGYYNSNSRRISI